MENRRRRGQTFEFALLAVLMGLFLAILFALVLLNVKPEVITLVGGWGGTVLAMIGMIVSFQFGSSKGSQLKDEAMNQKGPTNDPEKTPIMGGAPAAAMPGGNGQPAV